MPEFNYVRPYLYPKQLDAIFSDKRIAVIEASTKAGKTVACIVWLVEQALQGEPGQQFWWVAPSYSQAKIAFNRLKQTFTQGVFSVNEADLVVTLPSRAQITFKSGELPDKLYGEDVWAAVVDEASRVREEAWHAIRSTVTATRGKVRLIGNVKGRKNWFYHLARRAEEGDPGLHYAKLIAYDAIEAGVLAQEEVEDAQRTLPEQVFRELYLAEPADDGGNPFGGDQVISNCVAPLSNATPICWGWDLAKSQDWTVGIALDEAGRVCRFHRWQGSWRDTIRKILDISGTVKSLVDATGPGDPVLEYLQKEAPETMRGFKFSASSKQQLMEGLAIAIQQQEIGFPEGPISQELKSFEYQYTRTGVRYSAPEGQHDDCVCALGLVWKLYRKPALPAWIQAMKSWVAPAQINIFGR